MIKRLVVLGLIIAALSAVSIYFLLNNSPLFHVAAEQSALIDNILRVLFAIASVFFWIIVVVFTDSLLFFRRRTGDNKDGPPMKGNNRLELVWTLVPLAIVVIIGAWGGIELERIAAVKPDELRIEVTAFRFGWQFKYIDNGGFQDFALHLPVNRPVALYMNSLDVVHSFWVPDFGPKQDVVPGMITQLRLTPTKTGNYTIQCSQLCGYGHTLMVAALTVESESDFNKYVRNQMAQASPSPTPSSSASPPVSPAGTNK